MLEHFPNIIKDPVDRIIIATAVYHDLKLMSLDSVFPLYQINKPSKAKELLEKTYGIWQLEDGLEYQQKISIRMK